MRAVRLTRFDASAVAVLGAALRKENPGVGR